MGFRWNPPSVPLPPSNKESTDSSQSQHYQHQEEQALAESYTGNGRNDAHSIAFSPGRLFNPISFDTEAAETPPPPPPPLPPFPAFSSGRPSSYHAEGPPTVHRLIPPNTPFARAVVMGNTSSSDRSKCAAASNLTVQMNQIPHHPRGEGSNLALSESNASSPVVDEADSASGPSPLLAHSLPAISNDRGAPPPQVLPRRQRDQTFEIQKQPALKSEGQPFRKSRR